MDIINLIEHFGNLICELFPEIIWSYVDKCNFFLSVLTILYIKCLPSSAHPRNI